MAKPCSGSADVFFTTNISKQVNENEVDYIEIEVPFHLLQYLDSSHCDIQSLCRICLSADNCELVSLISKNENDILKLSDIFTAFTSIQLHLDDGLPSYICSLCRTQLVQCYEFQIKCQKSDCALKSLLKGEIVTKNQPQDGSMPIKVEVKNETDIVKINDQNLNEENEYLEEIIKENYSNNNPHLLNITQKTQKRKKTNVRFDDYDAGRKDLIPFENNLLKENQNRNEKKSYKCSFCSETFIKRKVLEAHIEQNHNTANSSFLCSQCKECFNSEHDLHLHSALHTKGLWKCNKCHKEFKAKSMLRRHIQRHMEKKRFTCGVCDKSFTELYALRRHSRVHTGEVVEKKYACNICDKRYMDGGSLAAHLSRHSGARPCVCARCGRGFASRRLLASHARVHDDRKPHQCTHCGRRFRHESTRNTHQRTHTGERPYVCSVCGKTFIQNSNLTLHMRTHTGEKPYCCEICKRKFTSCSSLKTHQRIHTGEKPYSCNVCGKKFSRVNITAHQRSHSGERPFACSACPKRFATAPRLRDHTRLHTGETPFECTTCTLKFATKSHLTRHEKGHKCKKTKQDSDVIKVEQADCDIPLIMSENFVITSKDNKIGEDEQVTKIKHNNSNKDILDRNQMTPGGRAELSIQNNGELENESLVVNDSQINCENVGDSSLCFNTNTVVVDGDINCTSDVNLVTVNDGQVSLASSAMLEGTTVKLYQLDQSLVQIHSSGGQVTISKITSKMTANF